jgi:hypothetical protein
METSQTCHILDGIIKLLPLGGKQPSASSCCCCCCGPKKKEQKILRQGFSFTSSSPPSVSLSRLLFRFFCVYFFIVSCFINLRREIRGKRFSSRREKLPHHGRLGTIFSCRLRRVSLAEQSGETKVLCVKGDWIFYGFHCVSYRGRRVSRADQAANLCKELFSSSN